MKKTLLVTLDYYPSVGGVSNYWLSLGEHIPASRFSVLAPSLPVGMKEVAVPYRIHRLRMLSRFFIPRWLPLIFKIMFIARREGIEAILAGQVLPVGAAVSVAARLLHIPYYISAHGMDVALPLRHSRKRILCGRILRGSRFVIANSEYTARIIRQYGVKNKRIVFVFPCPKINRGEWDVSSARIGERKEILLLTVGRLVKRKGHEYVIRALERLRDYTPIVYYTIVGDGSERTYLEHLATTLGIADRILFAGVLRDEAVRQWYRKCDIFIMTPYEIHGDVEGFGIVYLEANAFGKPVIASRSGGVESAVLHGKTGLIVAPQDVDAIVDAIRTLCDDPSYAVSLGSFGKDRVEQEFQWHAQAAVLIRLLSE
ncbi:glycosyltransferase family 4 protein [Candidatus Uhrbacteria bacterium]|nr:glycosyltransferase family 4 protein [Candidatus Uhrbacteria bacterium]